ncbi:MAG: dihydrolipoamide succinyltransferase, partial [Betaproteobacteria bacterium]|nr:dihydrolipoamide succinyltransferase [Betaproteobacteria bacterium]
MALIEVKVPQLSESVAEATLLSWHKKPGDAVSRDENLIDIETDKVVLELPAPDAGVLSKILKHDGDIVAAGEVIAMIDTEAKAAAAGATAKAPEAPAPTQAAAAASGSSVGSKQGLAMPAAAKLMAEQALRADELTGSGRDGRITKGDVLAA